MGRGTAQELQVFTLRNRIFSHYGAISEGKILATSILPRHFYLNNEDFAALLSQRLQLFT